MKSNPASIATDAIVHISFLCKCFPPCRPSLWCCCAALLHVAVLPLMPYSVVAIGYRF